MHELIAFNPATLAFGMPGSTEWIILLVLGLLIFGRRLPEVGRSLGRGIVEFKKGIKGIEDDIEDASDAKIAGRSSQQIGESAATDSSVSQAAVGSEGPNPYAPVEPAEKPQG
jgi:sec-independent protein translocase protein TatA